MAQPGSTLHVATLLLWLAASLPAVAASQEERLPGQRERKGESSNFGIVAEVVLVGGERIRLRDTAFGREDESTPEGGFLYADGRKLYFSTIRRITVHQVTKGLGIGRHALGGGTYGDIELVDGRLLANAKMSWHSVFGWERPGRRGKFHDIEARDILYIDFLDY